MAEKKTGKSLSAAPVRLGLMAPLTGMVELYGPEISWAGRIACDEVNEAGGVLGQPVELIIIDDGSLPDTAVPAARRLVGEYGCSAIIGNLLSNSRIAVADLVSEPGRTPHLNFSFYEGSIYNRYFFNFAALPNQQIEKMIPAMAKIHGVKMFFAGSNYEWPRGSIDAAKTALLACGGEIVGEEYLPLGSDKIDDLLERLAKSGADVFVPYFAGIEQVNLLNRFTSLGLKQRMAVVMGHYDEAMVGNLEPAVREGFYSSNTYFMSVDTQENRSYLERLRKLPEVDGVWPRGNGVLTNFGEGVYLCVHAFARAANQAGSTAGAELVDALEVVQVKTPQGVVAMDPLTHHAKVNTYLSRCNIDGTFTIVEEFGQIPPVIPKQYRDKIPSCLPDALLPAVARKPVGTGSRVDDQTLPLGSDIYRDILSVTDSAVLATNEEGEIFYANMDACDLFGYSEDEISGLSVHLLLPPRFRTRHKGHMDSFLGSDKRYIKMDARGEISGYRKDGSLFPAEAAIAKTVGELGLVLVATVRDITGRKKEEEQLIWKANHDPLTKLSNRAHIRNRLSRALERSQRYGGGVVLLFLDIDGFKLVNDSYGHDMGDRLLVIVADKLLKMVRPGDTVARFGGDEFVILCEQIDDVENISFLADRLNELFRQPVALGDEKIYATVSIGLAYGGAGDNPDDIFRNADAAMYQAKEQGRDGWRYFNEVTHRQSKQRLEIATGLRTAIQNGELAVNYQPIVDAKSEQIVGVELLLRWYPQGGEVSPGVFIPIAEMTDIIHSIGLWVFEQACLTEKETRKTDTGDSSPYISVNLSTRQLDDEMLVEKIRCIMDDTGADATRIQLEVTETSLMSDIEANIRTLTELNKTGLGMAVDDFGTGYSSLGQLLRLPVNNLKIDRMFVNDLEDNTDNRTIINAVITMAHALGLKVVAEGVETRGQLEILRDMDCDYIQGFLFYRPMNSDAYMELLNSYRKAYQYG